VASPEVGRNQEEASAAERKRKLVEMEGRHLAAVENRGLVGPFLAEMEIQEEFLTLQEASEEKVKEQQAACSVPMTQEVRRKFVAQRRWREPMLIPEQ